MSLSLKDCIFRMIGSVRKDVMGFGAVALAAFLSVPAFWLYLAATGLTLQEIGRHPVAYLTRFEWPLVYALAGQLAGFAHMAGKPVAQVVKPVTVIFLLIVVPVNAAGPVLFWFSMFFPIAIFFVVLPAIYYCWGYLGSRGIIRNWFQDQLAWQDTLRQKVMLAAVTIFPPVMAMAANFVHVFELYEWP